MSEWISVEDELIVRVAALLPLIINDLRHEISRRNVASIYKDLEDYIQSNNLDFTKEGHKAYEGAHSD